MFHQRLTHTEITGRYHLGRETLLVIQHGFVILRQHLVSVRGPVVALVEAS